MFNSDTFGRIFWVDDNNQFRSCPQFIDGTGDFANSDYVSDWQDWDGVDYDKLFNIHRICILNKLNYIISLSNSEVS